MSLIDVRIQLTDEDEKNYSEEKIKAKDRIEEFYEKIIETLKKHHFWDNSIKKVVVTNRYEEDFAEQAKLWNIQTQVTREKEYMGISKALFNQDLDYPEHYVYIPLMLHTADFPVANVVIKQFVSIYAKKIIPKQLRDEKYAGYPSSLKDHVDFFLANWCQACYAKRLEEDVMQDPVERYDHKTFLTAFKRKLRQSLFEYNNDKKDAQTRLNIFWQGYFWLINDFFERIIENQTEEKNLLIDDEEAGGAVYKIVEETNRLTDNLLEGRDYNSDELKKLVQAFSNLFAIELAETDSNNIHIKISKNPKAYFAKDLVDTVPSLVCFIDILGFSDLIEEYETNPLSSSLQDIQKAFETAMAIVERKNIGNKDWVDYIEYQTFSDNICISVPYFDNEEDYLNNFSLLLTYVRGLQYTLMTMGFFIRGGLSVGPHYSDGKMIFSKGLVNAYRLEQSKAIYPRVVVDHAVIDKVAAYSTERIRYYGLTHTLVKDWEGTVFVNPFNLLGTTKNQFENMMDTLQYEAQGIDLLGGVINALASSMSRLMTTQLDSIEGQNEAAMKNIKNHIALQKRRYVSNEKVLTKYIWLEEYMKWLNGKEESNLKFQYVPNINETEEINEK